MKNINIDFASKYTEAQVELTKSLLSSITEHLAKNSACSGKKTYRIAIGVYDSEQKTCRSMYETWGREMPYSIIFDIDAQILEPSQTGRRYYSPVMSHIIYNHFKEAWAGCSNGNQVQIHAGYFVPGIYEYKVPEGGRIRKWSKIV